MSERESPGEPGERKTPKSRAVTQLPEQTERNREKAVFSPCAGRRKAALLPEAADANQTHSLVLAHLFTSQGCLLRNSVPTILPWGQQASLPSQDQGLAAPHAIPIHRQQPRLRARWASRDLLAPRQQKGVGRGSLGRSLWPTRPIFQQTS